MWPDAVLRERFRLHVSAASGLAVRDGIAYVIADDGERLRRYRLDGERLPDVPAAGGVDEPPIAKPSKPDLEALLELPDGRLLAFGSGSRPNRERALLFDPRRGTARSLDLAPLYARIRAEIGATNIEGAARIGDQWVLGHRGAGRRGPSALVWLDAPADPERDGALDPAACRSVVALALPDLDGVPLALTDLAAHPTAGLHFLAAAEATDDPYEDAACAGSVIGRFDPGLRPRLIARLRPDVKAEGLAWWEPPPGEPGRWLVVADADDATRASPLYELLP